MALCSSCGGVKDLYPLPGRATQAPIEVDPFCPECGQPRHRTCLRCGGSGYIDASASVRLIREYCARCGEPIAQEARMSCPECGGNGRTGHFCGGWAWYARAHSQQIHVRLPRTMASSITITERAVALRPKRSRTLVRIGR